MNGIVGHYNAASTLTLIGLCLSVGVCAFALAGRLELALVCLIYAGFCDLFDGVVARRSRLSAAERAFGTQLDSIVDMASFGLAPVVLGLATGLHSALGWGVSLLYVCAAAQRLAHFNSNGLESAGGTSYYRGLPVTYAALIFPVAFAADRWLGNAFSAALTLVYLLVAVAFVAPVPIPKPAGKAYVALPAVGVALTVYWLVIFFRHG
jgi:CDP-diacylglycerol--serine O-phosphatidyltransferase